MNPKRTFLQKLLGVQIAQAPDVERIPIDTAKVRDAIAYNETRGVKGDPYLTSQPSGVKAYGNAMGRYRVTEAELKTYSPIYTGKPIDAKTFQKSKTAQDQYMDGKVKYFSDKGYTPEQIADIHRAGIKNSSAPGSTTYQNPGYVKSFGGAYYKPN